MRSKTVEKTVRRVGTMSGCGVLIDKLSIMCIGISLACIGFALYLMSGYILQISSIEQKLDIVHRKVDGILGIIGIVTEGAQDIITSEMLKQAHRSQPMDNLDVQEIKAVDEETKPVEAQEEDSASRPSGLAVPIEEVEATFETPEELK